MRSRAPFMLAGLVLVAWCGPVFADAPIGVFIDHHPVPLDVSPRIVDHRVLVPLRGVFEYLGATVDYHASTRVVTVYKGRSTVSLGVEAPVAFINRRAVHLAVAPHVFDSRVMVPLRFLSETLGARVQWTPQFHQVYITPAAAPRSLSRLTPELPPPPTIEDPALLRRVNVVPEVIAPGGRLSVFINGPPGQRGTVQMDRHEPQPAVEPLTGVYQVSWPVHADDVEGDRRPLVHVESSTGSQMTARVMRSVPLQGDWTPGEPIIARIETNGTDVLHAGQRLVVALDGSPLMNASFSLGPYVFPMPEERPGRYRGEYIVRDGDSTADAHLRVTLAGPSLRTTVDVGLPARFLSP